MGPWFLKSKTYNLCCSSTFWFINIMLTFIVYCKTVEFVCTWITFFSIFSIILHPRNFPSSFHGVHGKIAYTLTVGINRPWRMSKDFVTELKFVNHIDTNQPGLNVSGAFSDESAEESLFLLQCLQFLCNQTDISHRPP